MAAVLKDRVVETSTTTGTGSMTVAGAVAGFRTFSSVCSTGDTFPYLIEGVDADGVPTGEWEIGNGTYSGANTVARTSVVASSNSNSAVSFSSGTKRVQICLAADYLIGLIPSGGVTVGSHRYWLMKDVTSRGDGSATTNTRVGEIELRATHGGSALTPSSVSASSTASGNPISQAFDGNVATEWASGGNAITTIKIDLGSAQPVTQIAIISWNDSGYYNDTIVDFDLCYSDDGVTYTFVCHVSLPYFTSASQTQTADIPA